MKVGAAVGRDPGHAALTCARSMRVNTDKEVRVRSGAKRGGERCLPKGSLERSSRSYKAQRWLSSSYSASLQGAEGPPVGKIW